MPAHPYRYETLQNLKASKMPAHPYRVGIQKRSSQMASKIDPWVSRRNLFFPTFIHDPGAPTYSNKGREDRLILSRHDHHDLLVYDKSMQHFQHRTRRIKLQTLPPRPQFQCWLNLVCGFAKLIPFERPPFTGKRASTLNLGVRGQALTACNYGKDSTWFTCEIVSVNSL